MKQRNVKKMLAVGTILFTIALLAAGQAHAWTITADFEKGAVGQKAVGESAFQAAGSSTTISNTRAYSGAKSAKMVWNAGAEGFHTAMGRLSFPSKVGNGGEIWARGYFYFQSPWSWSCDPVVKVFRIHNATSSGGNGEYNSIFGESGGRIVLSNEPGDYYEGMQQVTSNTSFGSDKWVCLEIYVKLSPNAGKGVLRIWKNGEMVIEDTKAPTMINSSDSADFSYIMSYWNGNAPRNQTQYLDDFVITNQRPAQVDRHGNPMIGPSDGQPYEGSDPTSPSPPTGLKVID